MPARHGLMCNIENDKMSMMLIEVPLLLYCGAISCEEEKLKFGSATICN